MKVIKRELPEGERYRFEVKLGKKIKVKNSLYDKKKKKNKENKKTK